MKKTYILSFTILLITLLTACADLFSGYKQQMQLEIVDENIEGNALTQTKNAIKKRLSYLGAANITITGEKKMTINYDIGSDSLLVWQSFQTPGKLEFFEVCSTKNELFIHLETTFKSKIKDTLVKNKDTTKITISDIFDYIGIIPAQTEDYIFAYVTPKNKLRVASLLLNKKPVFVKSIGKKVKFLFGKETNGKFPLYALVVTSANKAPLDGSHITDAVAREAYSQGNFTVSFQMDKEGALIWERLTTHAYQTRSNIAIVIDDLVYSAPFVTSGPIKGGNCEISGNFSQSEATILASVIHSGALPKINILEIKSAQ